MHVKSENFSELAAKSEGFDCVLLQLFRTNISVGTYLLLPDTVIILVYDCLCVRIRTPYSTSSGFCSYLQFELIPSCVLVSTATVNDVLFVFHFVFVARRQGIS